MSTSNRTRAVSAPAARVLVGSIALLLTTEPAKADSILWDANGTTASQTDGTAAWLNADQWWNGTTNVTWTSGDDAVFGNGGAGGAVTLASPTTAGSFTFHYFTGTYTLGSGSQAITLHKGITKNAGSGIVSIASPIILGAAQTWTNHSTTALGTATTSTVDNGGFLLTIDGTGNTSFNGGIISGGGGLTKNGTGVLTLGGAAPNPQHAFTGAITINGGGILIGSNGFGTGTGNITINNGWIDQYFGNSFSRGLGTGAGQIQILGGTSGFSGQGATSSSFTISGLPGNELVWGSTFFKPDVFLLGSTNTNTNGKGSVNNLIDLSGSTRIITSNQVTDGASNSGFSLTGAIRTSTGTAGLTKTGVGNIILQGANTYNGATSIQGGSITLSGTVGAINSTSGLNLSGGILRLVNTAQVNRVADGAAITSNGGTISYENTSGANVYTETVGAIALTQGQLNLVETTNQAGAGSQTLTIGTSGSSNLTQAGTSSVTFSALTTGPQGSGNKNMFVVFGAGTSAANEIIGPWANTGTAAASQTDYAVYNSNFVVPANLAASGQLTWTTTTASTSNYTVSNAAGASTVLSATRNINSLRNTSVAANVTVDTATDVVTLAGHSFSNGDVFAFGGTAPTGASNGTAYYVRDAAANTFKVAASPTAAAIDFTGAGTPNVTGGITLSSGNNLGTFGILNAAGSGLAIGGSGTGVVTLPINTGAGNLYVTPGNGAVIVIGVPIADNQPSGVLTLVKNGSATLRLDAVNSYTGNTVINAGTLQLGTNGITNGATLGSGTYAGNIFIAPGATLNIQTNAAQTLSGVISGDGNVVKAYSGTLTLSGNNTYIGKTSITPITTAGGGTLSVFSFNSVNGGTPLLASSSLGAPTTVANGTIDFGNTGIQSGGTLLYTGSGETTDRVINFGFNGTGAGKTIDSGTGGGLLKFTSTFTANATATNDITLTGSSNGEIVGGLPVAFRNFVKSGNGTWTLGGAVGNTGTTTVNAGTMALQKTNSLNGGDTSKWTAANINVKGAATLALSVDSAGTAGFNSTGLNTLLTNISVASSATAGLQAGARLGFNTSTATGGTFTQGNAIANSTGANGGAIGVTKIGAGTLVFDKANTYTGLTTVSAGTLVVSGSLSASAATVGNTGMLKGSGSIGGSVTVQSGGTLAAGNSIESFATGALSLEAGSTFAFEINNDAAPGVAGDLTAVTGSLTLALANTANLTLNELGAGSWTPGEKLTLISYTGTWNGGLLNFGGAVADDSTITFSGTDWTFDYKDTIAGTNFTSDLTGTSYVTITAVPEPGTVALLGGMGVLALLRRRRAQS